MHANADLLQRLYSALDRHDHPTMASCYHPEAGFRDIAFNLQGIKKIHSMWHMISETDIRAEFEVIDATDRARLRSELHARGVAFTESPFFNVELKDGNTHQLLKALDTPLTLVRVHQPTLEEAYVSIVAGADD